jgi:hypothetical protein
MPHFTKAIETGHGLMNFYFNRIITAVGTRYHVSAMGRNNKVLIFHMEEIEGKWYVVKTDDTPYWLISIEKKLSDLIRQHLNIE